MSNPETPDAPLESTSPESTPLEPAPAKPARAKSARAAGVTTRDTAALRGAGAAPAADAPRRRIVVSQGTYEDLVRLRKVTDPSTGYELRVGAGGQVTAYDRATGEPADITVVCPPIP